MKEALRRLARSHGRSKEEEVRLILAQAAQGGDWASRTDEGGLGSRIAALFAGHGLEEPIATWHGREAQPADFGT
jgi:plasmid stability protein